MGYSFISGATGGIGKAFCFELAKSHNNLIITGRSEQKLSALSDELKAEFNVDVLYCACDLTDADSRKELVKFIKSQNIAITRIVNVAGVDIQKAFSDYTLEKVIFQTRVNVEGTICITHELLSITEEGGEIITVSSMSGVSPMPYFALYSATKSALTNFFTALHYELKDRRIHVTAVLPGGVYTRPDVIQDIKGQGLWGKLSAKQPEFVAKGSLKAVKRNKIKYIPGFFNRFLYCCMKIAPKRIVLRFIANRWKKQTKDAF